MNIFFLIHLNLNGRYTTHYILYILVVLIGYLDMFKVDSTEMVLTFHILLKMERYLSNFKLS